MKNILPNTESVCHKTLWIPCLLFLALHSFSSPRRCRQCYDSLRDAVSDFTFQERPWYSGAHEGIVQALDAKLYRAASRKCRHWLVKGFHSLSSSLRRVSSGLSLHQLLPVSFWSWPLLDHHGINSFSATVLVTMTIEIWCLFIRVKIEEEQWWRKPSKMSLC